MNDCSDFLDKSISDLQACYHEFKRARERYQEVTAPLLTDYSLIPYLLEIFRSITGKQDVDVENREKFVFIASYLYAPENIIEPIGKPLPRGLIKEMCKVFNLKARSVLSRAKANVYLRYNLYYRKEIDTIISLMVQRMQVDGLIPTEQNGNI